MNQTRVAILGSGNIGTDLLVKVCRSEYLECGVLIGRDPRSPGLAKASQYGVPVSAAGIEHLEREPDCCEIVFDATSALEHAAHAPILHRLGKMAIDLTPANLGAPCVPVVNVDECVTLDNVNVITCGGQASIPIAHALARTQHSVSYLEVVSSIAARSAGPATRRNLDEYIHTTEYGLTRFSGADAHQGHSQHQSGAAVHRHADHHLRPRRRTRPGRAGTGTGRAGDPDSQVRAGLRGPRPADRWRTAGLRSWFGCGVAGTTSPRMPETSTSSTARPSPLPRSAPVVVGRR